MNFRRIRGLVFFVTLLALGGLSLTAQVAIAFDPGAGPICQAIGDCIDSARGYFETGLTISCDDASTGIDICVNVPVRAASRTRSYQKVVFTLAGWSGGTPQFGVKKFGDADYMWLTSVYTCSSCGDGCTDCGGNQCLSTFELYATANWSKFIKTRGSPISGTWYLRIVPPRGGPFTAKLYLKYY